MIDAFDVHLLVLGPPATQLSLDVAVVARQVPESRAFDVDVVELGQGGGQMIADDAAYGLVEGRLGLGAVAQDRALHELHDVEGSLVDLFVDAESERLGHRHAERVEGRDDGVFAHHVVGRGEHVTGRRTP